MRVRRPVVRADCTGGGFNTQRPCGFVSCKWNLWSELGHGGSDALMRAKKSNVPSIDPTQLRYSCALDLADSHSSSGMTLEEVGGVLNVTRERARQVEVAASSHVREHPDAEAIHLAVSELGGVGVEASPGGWVYPPPGPVLSEVEQRRSAVAVRRFLGKSDTCQRVGCARQVPAAIGFRRVKLISGYCSWTCAHAAGATNGAAYVAGAANGKALS